jgi:hypothetical protein
MMTRDEINAAWKYWRRELNKTENMKIPSAWHVLARNKTLGMIFKKLQELVDEVPNEIRDGIRGQDDFTLKQDEEAKKYFTPFLWPDNFGDK